MGSHAQGNTCMHEENTRMRASAGTCTYVYREQTDISSGTPNSTAHLLCALLLSRSGWSSLSRTPLAAAYSTVTGRASCGRGRAWCGRARHAGRLCIRSRNKTGDERWVYSCERRIGAHTHYLSRKTLLGAQAIGTRNRACAKEKSNLRGCMRSRHACIRDTR